MVHSWLRPEHLHRPRYPVIDIFRGLAIVWIVLHHVRAFFDIHIFSSWGILFPFIDRITKLGHLGVEIFFVISGFVISGILIDWDQKVHIKRFYVRRAWRIIPLYAVTVIAGLTLVASVDPETFQKLSISDVAAYVLLIQNYAVQLPILRHTWFIAVIVHFYIVYAVIVWTVFRVRETPSDRRKVLIGSLVLLIVAIHIKRFTALAYFDPHLFSLEATEHRLDAIFLGCLIKLAEPWIMAQKERVWIPWLSLIAGAALYSYGMVFLFFGFHNHWYSYTLGYLAAGGLLITALLRPAWFRSIGFFRRLGPYAYGIFLVHPLIGFAVNAFYPWMPASLRLSIYGIGSLLAGIGLTVAVDSYIARLRHRTAAG